MESTRPDHRRSQTRKYDRSSSVVFRKTRETFGGLSNMAGGFPLMVSGVRIRTSEALYQACRFPHLPDVQRLIIAQRSPMTAKMKSKPYRHDSRQDWNRVRVNVMRWCLRVKLAQNWEFFSKLLLDTGDRAIVEQSHKDDFWGARPVDDRTLVGMNVLGRLLMELRESVKTEPGDNFLRVDPLHITDFRLGGRPIEPVTAGTLEQLESVDDPPAHSPRLPVPEPVGIQLPPTRPPKVAERVLREESNAYAANQGGGNLKPYPKMKDSGIRWLGEAPAHWEVTALRHRYDQCLGKMLDAKLITGRHLVPYLRNVDVQWDRINVSALPQIDIHPHEIERYTVRPGDLLACEGGEVGRCAIWEGAMEVCGYQKALHRLRPCLPERDRPRFLLYALRLAAERGAFNDGQESTIRHLTGEKLRAHRFAFPPAAEQRCIQVFLDHADRRIRGYIRAKEKLIALLEEQKQAIIHEAVTGQVDVRTGRPYADYRDSGVEWLGRVPSHWDVVRVKEITTSIEQGWSPQCDAQRAGDEDWGVLKVGCVNRDQFDVTENKRLPDSVRARSLLQIRDGDILVSRANTQELLGLAALVVAPRQRILLCDKLFRFRALNGVAEPEFLVKALRSRPSRNQIESQTNGASDSMQNIAQGVVRNLVLALPPLREQEQITQYLEQVLTSAARYVDAIHRDIDFANEYRIRLIADVVTGKLDVRDAAAALPEVDPLAADNMLPGREEADDTLDSGRENTATERKEFRGMMRGEGGGLEDQEVQT